MLIQFFIQDLSAAVDVYADWVDACDAVAKEDSEEHGVDFAPLRASATAGRPSAGRARDEEEDDNDDDIIDDEDGLGGYGGEGIVADDEY
jgi:transcription elongation factor Elf1